MTTKTTNKNQTMQQKTKTAFGELFTSFLPKDIIDFFSPNDLQSFIAQRYSFLEKRQTNELKINIDASPAGDWQKNKTIVEIIYQDKIFIVDSLREFFTRKGYEIIWVAHPTFALQRDPKTGKILSFDNGDHVESYIYLELARINPSDLASLRSELEEIYQEIAVAVEDWDSIQQVFFKERAHFFPLSGENDQLIHLLQWIFDQNMIVLGAALLRQESQKWKLNRSYGLFRHDKYKVIMEKTSKTIAQKYFSVPDVQQEGFLFYHSRIRCRVEKNPELNFLFLKGESNDSWLVLAGDFATRARAASVDEIPLIRDRYQSFIKDMGKIMGTHSKRMARSIFNYMPIEMKFALPKNGFKEVFNFLSQVYFHQKSTLNISWFGKYRFLIVATLPRQKFFSSIVEKLQTLAENFFPDSQVNNYVQYESDTIKMYFMVYLFEKTVAHYQKDAYTFVHEAERALFDWNEEITDIVTRRFSGKELTDILGLLRQSGFDQNYQNNNSVEEAVADIPFLMKIKEQKVLVRFSSLAKKRSLRLFTSDHLDISKIMPILSDFGFVIENQVYAGFLSFNAHLHILYIDDKSWPVNPKKTAEAVRAVFLGQLTSDVFNSLVISLDLDWFQLHLLKTIRSYMLQTSGSWSYLTINKIVVQYPTFLVSVIDYLESRFLVADAKKEQQALRAMESTLSNVSSIFDDQVLRQFKGITESIQRTNYALMRKKIESILPIDQQEIYLSIKIQSALVPVLPAPRPLYEIYVYSSLMKGVHLRGGKVARGGLRWSDRPDDFRVEILGLMKTQMVKNAVIVPVGSKGGFIVKNPAKDRDLFQKQGVRAYKTFISGLLDLTDNYEGKKNIAVDMPVADGFDPYLVVAADKGTASFSDIANEISLKYGFWLGDAFASGGSAGYNHKDYGITANGSWESIKHHFYIMGKDIYQDLFTVVAIGDMSGDVFGNGLLYSDKIELQAAFNHKHIFIDPKPDAAKSFQERKRLFQEVKGWDHYNISLLSKGGGIFSRDERSIKISPEMAAVFQIEAKELSGPELIKYLLCAPVDLLYNGGIGTYIKASFESHEDAGDKSNDQVRVNGSDIRARIIGEGGNLGLTQLGRNEYAALGGAIFTDALDNSGGVDMSDHEVNLKIALEDLRGQGQVKTMAARNQLLKKMGDSVAAHVLRNNYLQALAVSLDQIRSRSNIYPLLSAMDFLERGKLLIRAQEAIPDNSVLLDKEKNGIPATVLAILLGYVKMYLYDHLLADCEFDHEQFTEVFHSYFPPEMVKKYQESLSGHKLKREITTTVMTNNIVNILGSGALFEISKKPQDHTKIVHNYYLLNIAISGIEFRKGLYAKQGQISADLFHGILMDQADFFKQGIIFLLMFDIALDENFLRNLQQMNKQILDLVDKKKSNNSPGNNDLVFVLTSGLDQKYPALAQIDEKIKRFFYQSYLLPIALRAIFVWEQIKQKKSVKSLKLIDIAQMILWIEDILEIGSLRRSIYFYQVKNEWEYDFQQKLLFRLNDFENQILLWAVGRSIDDSKNEQSIIKELVASKDQFPEIISEKEDLLYYEYLLEKTLGKILQDKDR